jgi:hypothetical protein
MEPCNTQCNELPVLQVRDKEADIDSMIAPIEDMYSLLLRYEVGGETSSRSQSHTATTAQQQCTIVTCFPERLLSADLRAVACCQKVSQSSCRHSMRVMLMLP